MISYECSITKWLCMMRVLLLVLITILFAYSLAYLLTYSGNDVALGTDLGAAMTGPVSEAYVGGGG